jgi:hypothetical protein
MEITIDYRTVLSLEIEEGASVSVAKGRLWMTRGGDRRDYFLAGGESAVLPEGSWLVQALARSRFSCEDGARE